MPFLTNKPTIFPAVQWIGFAVVSAVVFTSCKNPQSQIPASEGPRGNMNYKAAYFEDNARLEKLKNAYPAADSMLRKFVEENHIPGLAYGIVIDGKLVHTANFGFSDISKK